MEKTQFNKDRLFMRLMNGKACEIFKDTFPCDSILNLTVGYRWLNEQEDGIRTSEPLRTEQMKAASLKQEELFELAKKNTENLFSTRLYKLGDLVKRICEGTQAEDHMNEDGALDKSELYVCTNDSGMFGAAVIFIDRVIKKIAERLGGSIYILPSSIHEVIIVPKTGAYDVNMLKETVHAVNSSVVADYDYLSDSVYQYETAIGRVEIAS